MSVRDFRRLRPATWAALLVAILLASPATTYAQSFTSPAHNHYHRARDLKKEGRLREAVPLLEQALGMLPSNGYFALELGDTYLQLNEHERARSHLEKAVASLSATVKEAERWANPNYHLASAQSTLGRAYALLGERSKAEAAYRQALHFAQAHASGLKSTALFDWAEAQELFAGIYEGLGQSARAKTLLQEAIGRLETAAATNAFDSDDRARPVHEVPAAHAHELAAGLHERLKDYTRARASRLKSAQLLEAALKKVNASDHERREHMRFALANTYRDAGELERARAAYQAAMKPRPDGKPSQIDARDELRELEQEIAAKRVAANSHAKPEEYFRRGFEALRARKLEDATAAFQAGLATKPGDALAHFYLAETLYRRRDARGSTGHYLAALRAGLDEPQASRARRSVAGIYFAQWLSGQGNRNLREGPSTENLARAALFHARVGEQAAAKTLFAAALESATSVEARLSVAKAQVAAGDFLGAKATARKLEEPTVRVEAMAALAMGLAKRGALREANGIIGEALEEIRATGDTVQRVRGLRHVVEALWEMGNPVGARNAADIARVALAANTGVARTTEEYVQQLDDIKSSGYTALNRRGYASIDLVLALLKIGDRAGAQEIGDQVREDETRMKLVREVAKAGYPEAAERWLGTKTFTHAYDENQVLQPLAQAYAKKGNFEAAWRIAQRVREDNRKDAYRDIAGIIAGLGDLEGAKRALAARLKSANLEDRFVGDRLQRAYARGLALRGDLYGALQIDSEPYAFDDYPLELAYAAIGMNEAGTVFAAKRTPQASAPSVGAMRIVLQRVPFVAWREAS